MRVRQLIHVQSYQEDNTLGSYLGALSQIPSRLHMSKALDLCPNALYWWYNDDYRKIMCFDVKLWMLFHWICFIPWCEYGRMHFMS